MVIPEAFHDDMDMDMDMGSAIPFADTGIFDGFYYGGFGGAHGHDDYGLVSHQLSPTTVVLDGGGGGLPDAAAATTAASTEHQAPAPPKRRTNNKGDHHRRDDDNDKAAMALKSHSEAERRRRERINAHLATLRTMVPCSDKMDKAALLAEVITHVKKLKATAARVRDHCAGTVPADADDVSVELVHGAPSSPSSSTGGVLVRATLSCDDGADVFADVKHALRPLRLAVVGSEVSMLGGRVRFTFLIRSPAAYGNDGGEVVESVQQALQSVVDRANSALEFAPRASLLNKRRRVSTFESSSSSS